MCRLLIILTLLATAQTAVSQGFIENKGQLRDEIKYYCYDVNRGIAFCTDGLIICEYQRTGGEFLNNSFNPVSNRTGTPDSLIVRTTRISLRLNNTDDLKLSASFEQTGRLNFYKGRDQGKWAKGLRSYSKVSYSDANLHMLVEFTKVPGGIDWNLNPEFPGRIEVSFSGYHALLEVDSMHSLTEILGKVMSKGSYANNGNGEMSGCYGDGLIYSSFFGGSLLNEIGHVIIDKNGDFLLSGSTTSPDFPLTSSAIDTLVEETDLFVSKLDHVNMSLVYSTFLGGTDFDLPCGLVITDSMEIVVAGSTESDDFPVTPGVIQGCHGGQSDGFISVLSKIGDSLLSSTFWGGDLSDLITDFKVSGSSILFCGVAAGEILTTPGSFQAVKPGPGHTNTQDGFFTRINLALDSLYFSSYLGGISGDWAQGLSVEQSGDILICGHTEGAFPVTPGAFDTTFFTGSFVDGFIARISSNGDSLLYSGYLGGQGWDQVFRVRTLDCGDVMFSGTCTGPGLPVTSGACDTLFNSNREGFLCRFDSTLTQLEFLTLIGNGGWTFSNNTVADDGSYYLFGSLTHYDSSDLSPCAFDTCKQNTEGYIYRLAEDGSHLFYGTFYGGSEWDCVNCILETGPDTLMIVGSTSSPDFITTPGCLDSIYNCPVPSGSKGFISRLALQVYPLAGIGCDESVCYPDSLYISNTSQCIDHWKWYFGDGDSSSDYHPVHKYSQPGTYALKLVAGSIAGTDTVEKTIHVYPSYQTTTDTAICKGDSIWAGGMYRHQSGVYTDTLSSQYLCDSVVITTLKTRDIPFVSLPADTVLCEGSTLLLYVFEPACSYTWSTGDTTAGLMVVSPGIYGVSVTNAYGCITTATTKVLTYALPVYDLTDSAILCEGEPVMLNVNPCDSCYVSWWNGDTAQWVEITTPGIYSLRISNLFCTVFDSVEVEACTDINVPNVFTPNGDMRNDRFTPEIRNAEEIDMTIYNSWGREIYRGRGEDASWDGKYNDSPLPEGTYYYVIRWKGWAAGYSPDSGTLRGAVMLLR